MIKVPMDLLEESTARHERRIARERAGEYTVPEEKTALIDAEVMHFAAVEGPRLDQGRIASSRGPVGRGSDGVGKTGTARQAGSVDAKTYR